MKLHIPILLILFSSCTVQPIITEKDTTDHSKHEEIVMKDLDNKQREIVILREIKLAQDNNDTDAYEFFLQEYFDVPRLELTADQKQHPQYKEWLTDEQIKSAAYMSVEFDYVK